MSGHEQPAALIRDMAHDLRIDGNELEADALLDLVAENERLLAALELVASMEQEPSSTLAQNALNGELNT